MLTGRSHGPGTPRQRHTTHAIRAAIQRSKAPLKELAARYGLNRKTVRQHHAAGEKVFVDFAGDTIDVIDPVTGLARAMKLFVAALGASSYVYCEARPREGVADWIGCHVGMFAFFGGVTAIIACDNLKTAVTNPDRYDPGINRTYQDMARHYGTSVVPARPYKPRDKARSSSRCCWSSAGCWRACATSASSAWLSSTWRSASWSPSQRPRHARLRRQPGRTPPRQSLYRRLRIPHLPLGDDSPPQLQLEPGAAKRLVFPKVTDPVALPIRPERHVPTSIPTIRRRHTVALANRLQRCPCCARATDGSRQARML